MKLTHVYVVILAIGVALLAGAQSDAPKGPQGQLVWSSFVSQPQMYDVGSSGSNVLSSFTPGRSISVTRVQAQALNGPRRFIVTSPPTVIACTNNPGFKITDGTTSYTLTLATALVLGNASSTDSGPINISFPSGSNIALRVVQGDAADPLKNLSPCYSSDINLTVQYRTP